MSVTDVSGGQLPYNIRMADHFGFLQQSLQFGVSPLEKGNPYRRVNEDHDFSLRKIKTATDREGITHMIDGEL